MQEPEREDALERQFAMALKSEPETDTPDCLTPEQMLALAEKRLPKAAMTAALSHASLCSRCRREYAETAELLQLSREAAAKKGQTAPAPVRARTLFPSWRAVFAPGAAFAFGAACLVLFFAYTVPAQRQRDRLAAELKMRELQGAQAVKEKAELNRELTMLREAHNADARLAEQTARLRAANKSQSIRIAQLAEADTVLRQLPVPTAAWKLRMPNEQGRLRGSEEGKNTGPSIRLLRPVDTAVSETRPLLEFLPPSGAASCRVRLEMANSNEACPAPVSLSATRWQPGSALIPGQIYQWTVTGQRNGKPFHSAVGVLYVLSASENREAAQARRTYAKNPLALGAVYARLGLRREAAAQLRAALKANPAQSEAKRWLKEMQAQAAY